MKHTGRGLLVRSPWADFIVDSNKTWELRGSRTNIRGKIDIILSGSGCIIGTADLVDCIGPLTRDDLCDNVKKHRVGYTSIDDITYDKVYAWVLENAKRFDKPVPYKHPSGAVIWVKT